MLPPGIALKSLRSYLIADRIKVSYFTSQAASLEDFHKTAIKNRLRNLKEVVFCKTWTLPNGEATIVSPTFQGKGTPLWTG